MGETCGVLLAGAASTLINNGSISSSDNNFSTTGVHITGGNSTVINNGTVSTNGGRVILGGDTGEEVVNRGSIYGYVALGDGTDYFVNDGGSVFGIVDLGDGDDTFSSKDGYFSGSVTGGGGNDAYFIHDTLTEIIEEAGDGDNDTVHAFVSYSLGANFENLSLKGGADLTGRGNSLDNDLTGNAGDNKLYGRGGNDFFQAGEGSDLCNGGAGTDTVSFSSVTSGVTVNLSTGKGGGAATGQVFAGIENIEGTDFKDRIVGSAAANRLDGRQGNDTLTGGAGKDIFVFRDTYHTDTIADFRDKIDRIELDFSGLASFSDLEDMISRNGSDVVINFTAINGGTVVIIKNADISDFSGADFIFV
jgi:Ca2+-binding RTX toxin-like protein